MIKLENWKNQLLKKSTEREYIFLILDIVLTCVGIVILIHRSLFGICYTDDSWYIAEPYIVSEGGVPYTNNWSQASGFTIPLALFTRLYTFFTGSTEGIFLFSRIEYIVWLLVIGGIIWFFLNLENEKKKVPIIILLPFCFITPHQLFSINYNTIGLVYLLLACCILLVDYKSSNTKSQFARGVIGGIIIARAVIGTPYILLPCAIMFVYFCYEKEWKKLQGYICGGSISAVLVIGWCCFRGGIHEFIRGLGYWLNDCAYFQIEIDFFSDRNIADFFSYFKMFICCIVLAFILRFLVKENEKYEKLLYILLSFFLICGFVKCYYTRSVLTLIYWGWFEPIVLYLFSPSPMLKKRIKPYVFIIILYCSVLLFSSFGNIYGFIGREYWLYIPLIISIMLLLGHNIENILTKFLVRFGILVLALLMIRSSYASVFDDEPISNLTERIESGIWKGLYTTKERAVAVVELEKYIKEVTEKEDNVLFMDWASFGYLMSNGTACTSTAYDAMQYSYGVNNPKIMYDYFSITETVPDKIIYIDFGRDEMLSIEDSNWKFNKFVNDNYNIQSVSKLKLFRVVVYEVNSEQKALEMSKILIE